MRLGKPVENLQGALRAFYGTSPAAEQILTIAKQLSYFGYLSHDALVWVRDSFLATPHQTYTRGSLQANTVKFFNLAPSTAARVNKTANRFWLSGILLSILHGLLKVCPIPPTPPRSCSILIFSQGRASRQRSKEASGLTNMGRKRL